MASNIKRPDSAAMERVLTRYAGTPEEAILRLAWQAGLSRAELNALLWTQVDLEHSLLVLPDRTVPVEPPLADCLRDRHARFAARSDRVILSDRSGRPMTPENVSRITALALRGEGLHVSLMDLRHDYILRQIETHGWAFAARVSGMTVATLRSGFGPHLKQDRRPAPAPADRDETEYALWRIVQQEGSSTAGLAIWMCWKLGLKPGEAAALTWSQVDFAANLLHLPDRDVSMGSRLHRLLSEVWDRQKDLNEPRVFVAPTTGRPIDLSRISVVSRTAMIRGGLEGFSLRTLCAWSAAQQVSETLVREAEQRGSLIREDVIRLLNVSENTAWSYLNRLAESGQLIKVGVRYYPPGRVVAPEDQTAAVRAYLSAHGTALRRDLVDLLRVTPHQATHILRQMVDRGELLREGKRYRLPPA